METLCSFCGKDAVAYLNGKLACQECVDAFAQHCLAEGLPLNVSKDGKPHCILIPKDPLKGRQN